MSSPEILSLERTPSVRNQFEQISKRKHEPIKRDNRARVLMNLHKGFLDGEISMFMDISNRSVRNLRARIEEEGIVALNDRDW